MDDFANAGIDGTDRFCLRDLQIHRCQRLGTSEIVVCPTCGCIDTAEEMALHPVTYLHPVIWRALAMVARGAGRSGRGDMARLLATLDKVPGECEDMAAPWPGTVPHERHFQGHCHICGCDIWDRHPRCEERGRKALDLLRWIDAGNAPCPICQQPLIPSSSRIPHRPDCELAALLREMLA